MDTICKCVCTGFTIHQKCQLSNNPHQFLLLMSTEMNKLILFRPYHDDVTFYPTDLMKDGNLQTGVMNCLVVTELVKL